MVCTHLEPSHPLRFTFPPARRAHEVRLASRVSGGMGDHMLRSPSLPY